MKSIVNGRILIPDGVIDQKVLTFDQRIAEIASEPPEEAEIIDAKDCYVAPGLIDVHCHGFMGWDTSRASVSDLKSMCAHLVRSGVTSWLPTTLTLPWPELEKCFAAIREVMRESALPEWRGGAQVLGCHAEGPFISPRRKGAQCEAYIQRPEARRIKPWASVIRLITVAPEVDGALDFIRAAKRLGIAVSMGHSDATAEQAFAAIEAGVTHVTHTFNAMAPLNHHSPGLVGAALNDDRVYCELIADGLHVSPLLLPLLARLKLHRLVLITDSIQSAGLPDGVYDQLGVQIRMEGECCRLMDGTIAGSTLTMDKAVRNFVRYSGIPVWRAVNMASLYPARAIGMDSRKGALQRGKDADIVIADRHFNVRATFVGGECVYRAQ